MTMTPETIARHELIGRHARVLEAPNADLVGLAGTVIRETTRTLVIRPGPGRLGDPAERPRQVPKRGTTFAFRVDDAIVHVDGERLVARPARRTAVGGVSPWV